MPGSLRDPAYPGARLDVKNMVQGSLHDIAYPGVRLREMLRVAGLAYPGSCPSLPTHYRVAWLKNLLVILYYSISMPYGVGPPGQNTLHRVRPSLKTATG